MFPFYRCILYTLFPVAQALELVGMLPQTDDRREGPAFHDDDTFLQAQAAFNNRPQRSA